MRPSQPSAKRRKRRTAIRLATEQLETRRVLTTFNFPADGSIDDIVAAANADVAGAPHTINLNADAVAAGELVIGQSTTIHGNGNVLNGSGSSRVLHFNNNDISATDNAVNDLIITGGDQSVTGGTYGSTFGGGIRNTENLVLTGVTVQGNQARGGGGISNSGGTLTVIDSTISRNVAVSNASYGSSSTGGGVFNSGTLDVLGSTISGNTSAHDDLINYGSFGGGITNSGYGGVMTLTESLVSGNSAELGAGIFGGASNPASYSDYSTTTLIDTDVVGNYSPAEGYARGGGLQITGSYSAAGTGANISLLTITGGSINDNTVASQGSNFGGGISLGSNVDAEISDTVITGNIATGSAGCTGFCGRGAGIYATSFQSAYSGYAHYTELDLNNVTISDNTIPRSVDDSGGLLFPYGAGVVAGRGVILNMNGGVISGNTAGDRGNGAARGVGLHSVNFSLGNPNATNDVRLDGVRIANNVANDGYGFGAGATAAQNGNLIITNSTITGNESGFVGAPYGFGGGLATLIGYSNLTVEDTHIYDNFANGDGGGIRATYSEVQVRRSTIEGNQSGYDGGGISSYASNLTVQNTTISGNAAANEGGAIWSFANLYYGGLEIDFSTITENTADTTSYYGGGAVFDLVGTGPTGFGGTITNSIISGNGVADFVDPFGYTSVSYSLVSDTTQAPGLIDGIDGNIIGATANLGPLVNNSSANGVPTHELLGPLGIGSADPSATAMTDGRGLERPGIDGVRDIGAHESDAIANLPEDLDLDGDVDCDDMDIISMEISSGGSNFDLNMDGSTNMDDLTLVRIAGMINEGDFNCDGFTDVSDFGIWNVNKFTVTGKWSEGDANLDGSTDVSDFGIWNTNKFTSFDGDRSSHRRIFLTDELENLPAGRNQKGHGGAHFHGKGQFHFSDRTVQDLGELPAVPDPLSSSQLQMPRVGDLTKEVLATADLLPVALPGDVEPFVMSVPESIAMEISQVSNSDRSGLSRAQENVDQVFTAFDLFDDQMVAPL